MFASTFCPVVHLTLVIRTTLFGFMRALPFICVHELFSHSDRRAAAPWFLPTMSGCAH
jgi:hypothetical protein